MSELSEPDLRVAEKHRNKGYFIQFISDAIHYAGSHLCGYLIYYSITSNSTCYVLFFSFPYFFFAILRCNRTIAIPHAIISSIARVK